VSSLRHLSSLTLRDSPLLSDDGIAAITAALTRRRKLTCLDLANSTRFSNEALLVLLQVP
jgi:ribonuclease HIII